MRKIWLRTLSIACCLGILCSTAVLAAEDPPPAAPATGDASIEVLRLVDEAPVKNAGASIYRVADFVQGEPSWTEEYAGYQLTLKPNDQTTFENLPQNLVTVINRDNKAPLATTLTGNDGKALFSGLSDGLYLINGARYQSNGYYYDPIPVLVFVPFLTDEQTEGREVHLEMKHNATRVPSSGGGESSTISRKVLKVWNDISNEESRPESITVQLLNGEKVVDTQRLSEKNNWRFTWSNLSRNGDWSVVEPDVPKDYSVSVRKEGVTFVVTNTFEEDMVDNKTPETEKPEESQPPVEESQPPVAEVSPSGYDANDTVYMVKVDNGYFYIDPVAEEGRSSIRTNEETGVYEILNEKSGGPMLPLTGSCGIYPVYAAATSMFGVGFLLTGKKKRKEDV